MTSSLSESVNPNSQATNKPTYTVRFQSQGLNSLVENNEATVYVFAYCNPNQQIMDMFLENDFTPKATVSEDWANQVLNVAAASATSVETSIWQPNHFLMTNSAESDPVTIPALPALLANHNNVNNPLDLGIVEVERAAARFDFAATTTEAGVNTYTVKDAVTELPVANVVIDALALNNMAKEFYALPRVSADGTMTGATLLGRETPSNWVVSPYAAQKAAADFKASTFADGKYLFPFPGYDLTAQNYDFTPVSTILGGTEDKAEQWANPDNMDYRIWTYATENTIPALNSMQVGITTGVIFRAELQALADVEGNDLAANLKTAMQNKKVLYTYDGRLYGDRAALEAAANEVPGSSFQAAYQRAFVDANMTAGDLTQSVDGFGIYRPTTDGKYYMYYFYENRHNDNGNNSVHGVMEFATVRNNVYKLSIDNILAFGHPTNDKDDPDPENPDDPDENPEVYFKVSCRVLPWVVRVNKISF